MQECKGSSSLYSLIPRKTGTEGTEYRSPPLPENYQIPILYQDENVVIVDKPYDVRVDGDFPVTAEKLIKRTGLSMDRFRLCNQLDYSTSGILVVGLNKKGANKINRYFRERLTKKWYLAVCMDENPSFVPALHSTLRITEKIYEIPNDFRMRIDNELGLDAETHATLIKKGVVIDGKYHENFSLFLVKLITGRRHQIRLHLKHIGYPIVGDATYGLKDRSDVSRMMLHAFKLVIPLSMHAATRDIVVVSPGDENFARNLDLQEIIDLTNQV